MEKVVASAALAAFDRWHADEMRRISERGRGWRVVVLGSGTLVLAVGVAVWLF